MSGYPASAVAFLLVSRLLLPSAVSARTPTGTPGPQPAQTRMFNRANAYYRDGEYKRAIILYRKAVLRGVNPAIVAFNIGNCYFQAGDLPSAAASYRRAVKESGGAMVNAHFNLAGVHYRLNNYGEAIAAYRRGLARDASNADAWLYLAEACEKTGDPVGAQKALEAARELRPDDVGIVYQLAEIHVTMKEIDRAVELVRRAFELTPEETDFLFYAGDLYLLDNRTEAAIGAYREALAVDPDNHTGHYRLADILARDGRRFLAMEHLSRALAIKPDYTDAAIFLGNLAFDLQWWDRALDAYQQALSHGDRESIIGMVNIAFELIERKDMNKAREVAGVLRGIEIRDPVMRREWEEIRNSL